MEGSLKCTIAFLIYSLSSTTMVEPLSALFMTIWGFKINSLSAILSCQVILLCLYFSVSNISILILCGNVSRVPLLVSRSGLGSSFCLRAEGVSLGSLFCFCDVFEIFSSYIVINLCQGLIEPRKRREGMQQTQTVKSQMLLKIDFYTSHESY